MSYTDQFWFNLFDDPGNYFISSFSTYNVSIDSTNPDYWRFRIMSKIPINSFVTVSIVAFGIDATFGSTSPTLGFHDGIVIFQDGNDAGMDQNTAAFTAVFFEPDPDNAFAFQIAKDWLGPDEPNRGYITITVS